MLCSRDALASYLELAWCGSGIFWSLYLCPLGTSARNVVTADQGCPGMWYTWATFVGQLGQVWARSLGLTEVLGLDLAFVHALKVEEGA